MQNKPVRYNGTQPAQVPPPAVTAGPVHSPVDLSAIWNTIRHGKWVILLTMIGCTAFAIAYSLLATPQYQASSVVSITATKPLPGVDVGTHEPPSLSNEIGILTESGEIAHRVSSGYVQLLDSRPMETTFEFAAASTQDRIEGLVDQIMERMVFRPAEREGLLVLIAQSSNPQEAQILANLYASAYEEHVRDESRRSLQKATGWLTDQIRHSQAEEDSLQQEFAAYSRSRDLITQGADGSRTISDYWETQSLVDELQGGIRAKESLLTQLRQDLRSASPKLGSSQAESVRRQIGNKEERIDELQRQIDPWYTNNPSLRGNEQQEPQLMALITERDQLQREKATLTQQLLNETIDLGIDPTSGLSFAASIQSEIRKLEIEIETDKSRLVSATRRLGTLSRQADAIPSISFEASQFQTQLEMIRGRKLGYMEDLQSYRLQEEAELGYVSQVRRAALPLKPVSPDLHSNIILSLLLGTVLGLGLAFVRGAMKNQLQTPDEIEHMGYLLLGIIPSMRRQIRADFDGKESVEIDGTKRSSALMTLHSPWSPIAEHYRLVRTNLMQGIHSTDAKVIIVTSPEPSDGKSVTCTNLAISLAQTGQRVLLIDADLRRPSVHKLVGQPRTSGLGEMLVAPPDREIDFEALETEIENLSILQAGNTDIPPPELIGSPRTAKLFEKLREEYDQILVDSPPVLAVTDALVIAPHCDAAVIVVSANKTAPRAVNTTVSAMENVGVTIAGLVFNKYDVAKSGGAYYKYDYSYSEG